MTDATAVCVDPARIPDIWPFAREFILSARKRVGMTTDEPLMLAHMISGKVLLWIAWGREGKLLAAVQTMLEQGSEGPICHIMSAGGVQMKRWLHLMENIESYAKSAGCVRTYIEGRCGWQRALRRYKPVGVILEKDLRGG